jgi:elongation factor Ts
MSIDANVVMELRTKTGAGVMDCKKALAESGGDLEQAVVFLRKKGLASAAKKAGRETREGLVGSYIHAGGKIGVMVEINCETDFVARNEEFQELVKNVAMHIAAANPSAVRREQLDPDAVAREREFFKAQAAESGKPKEIVEKIAEGRMQKWYAETVLLEQAFVRDPDQTVEEVVKAAIAKFGENIQIKRFSRFVLGESDS